MNQSWLRKHAYLKTGGIGEETNCDEQNLDLEVHKQVYSLKLKKNIVC